ncbi:LacI family DNA-binding transcriptional regulator [Streptacidiphilus jiangxiensis]|uniref:LacI family transcriptional regulator n=1 Tax=Streptacidiphilus jiangxiensis TaxID=235985 RepID=A0A1H7QS59_STRJI|nr:LacI family DNA-binding transcriptional regulator [Streptacidiphilus jiangxiensis]SEL50465.1 LacI family transcriptional regulator [Streptacidiphilus jiangxiensis]
MSEEGRAPTIYDVARLAGVAPSTVSRAFSRPGRVGAETAARVHAAAGELGYRANPLTRARQSGRTGAVGLIVSDVTNPVHFGIIRGVEEAAARAGYTMLLADAQESEEHERTALERLLPGVDGMVLASSRSSDRAIRAIAKQRPLVVLNRIVPGSRCVVADTEAGVRSALAHLRELGHHAVTYVAGPAASWADGRRWRALLDLGPEHGLKVTRVGSPAPTVSGGLAATAELLRARPTAVVAYNDLLAIGLLRGLAEAGVDVPGQTSVVGFDNIFGADICTPPLTTVAAPLRAIGSQAFLELHRQLDREPLRAQPVLTLPTQLVVRASTAARRRHAD